MMRFEERQTVTFLSALTLGLTSFAGLFMYLLKKKTKEIQERYAFWLISAFGFFYLCMDEYFMAHEGIDDGIVSLFGATLGDLNLDGLVLSFFGLIGLYVCFYFRKVILKYKVMIPFLISGGGFLIGTAVFNHFEKTHVYFQVVEESLKIAGVFVFFAAYLLATLSFMDEILITSK